MTTTITHPFPQPELHAAYQAWSTTTGCDATTPEWASVWDALQAKEVVGDHGLVLSETDAFNSDLVPGQSLHGRIIQVALLAAMEFVTAVERNRLQPPAQGRPNPEPELGYQIDPVLAVEIALELIFRQPPSLEDPRSVLAQPVQTAVHQLAAEMIGRVVGVFDNAKRALHHELLLLETASAEHQPAEPPVQEIVAPEDKPSSPSSERPPLIMTILGEVLRDDVVAEAVFIALRHSGATGTDFAKLPRGHWLVYRTGSPLRPAERDDTQTLRRQGNLIDDQPR